MSCLDPETIKMLGLFAMLGLIGVAGMAALCIIAWRSLQ